jgi:protein SCO1/2
MRIVRRLLWAAVGVAALGLYAGHRLSAKEQPAPRGDLGRVPNFVLTDQQGRSVSDRDLRGSVWVANFIFTRCPSACPLLTAKFKALQAKLDTRPDLRFVSISVDPEHDTPQVLAAYAARFGADPARWRFLTGPLADIERTVVQGFKIHVGAPTPNALDPSLIDIMHGEHFVLVDRDGAIRGYYRADDEGLAALRADLDGLLH